MQDLFLHHFFNTYIFYWKPFLFQAHGIKAVFYLSSLKKQTVPEDAGFLAQGF